MRSILAIQTELEEREETGACKGSILKDTRQRQELLDYELASGRAAAKELSETLMTLGNILDRLAEELDNSVKTLSDWCNSRSEELTVS